MEQLKDIVAWWKWNMVVGNSSPVTCLWSFFDCFSEPPTEEKQSFSLEQKSKTSKKRVHYMKFTKGECGVIKLVWDKLYCFYLSLRVGPALCACKISYPNRIRSSLHGRLSRDWVLVFCITICQILDGLSRHVSYLPQRAYRLLFFLFASRHQIQLDTPKNNFLIIFEYLTVSLQNPSRMLIF